MFDTDGNQRVDKNEFLVVSTDIFLLCNEMKTHHLIHSYYKTSTTPNWNDSPSKFKFSLVATINGINNIV